MKAWRMKAWRMKAWRMKAWRMKAWRMKPKVNLTIPTLSVIIPAE